MATTGAGIVAPAVVPRGSPALMSYDVNYDKSRDRLDVEVCGRGLEVYGCWVDVDMGTLVHREVGPPEAINAVSGASSTGATTATGGKGCVLKVSVMSNDVQFQRLDEHFTIYRDGSYRARGKGLQVVGPVISSGKGPRNSFFTSLCPCRSRPY